MKKNTKFDETDKGNGLFFIQINHQLMEEKGKTLSERLRHAVRDFLNFSPKKEHISQAQKNTAGQIKSKRKEFNKQ